MKIPWWRGLWVILIQKTKTLILLWRIGEIVSFWVHAPKFPCNSEVRNHHGVLVKLVITIDSCSIISVQVGTHYQFPSVKRCCEIWCVNLINSLRKWATLIYFYGWSVFEVRYDCNQILTKIMVEHKKWENCSSQNNFRRFESYPNCQFICNQCVKIHIGYFFMKIMLDK